MHTAKCPMHNLLLAFCIVHCALCIAGCSVPNLEDPQCSEARDSVKRFYSFHFGNDMSPSPENLKARQRFLTDDLYHALRESTFGKTDYFTKSDDYPRTFKIGKCTHTPDASNLTMQVQLYWRDDQSTVQKEVEVDVLNRGNVVSDDMWLINKVTN